MGFFVFDQYTYLHFAVGIVAYFWNFSLIHWLALHTVFEFLENRKKGIDFINRYMVFWPGGKPSPDSLLNSIGDTIGALVGWLSAFYLDQHGHSNGWYSLHIK